jgi:hypothetical protein
MLEYFKSLLQHAKIGYSRTSALNPVQWIFVVSTGGLLASLGFHAPPWILILFGVFSALTLILFGFSFLFFVFKDKDALRSERYSISKIAIEKGLIGDDLKGLLDVDSELVAQSSPRLLESAGKPDEHRS